MIIYETFMFANLLTYKIKRWIKAYGKYLRLSVFLLFIYFGLYLVANNVSQRYIYSTINYLQIVSNNLQNYISDTKFYFNNIVNKKNIVEIENEKLTKLEDEIKRILLEKRIIEDENLALKNLLNLVQQNQLKIVSTRAFINQNNLFYSYGVVYTQGINLKKSDFVLGKNALLGIIYDVGTNFAKFNLVTNPDVRISVINTRSRDLCMTLGAGSRLKLIYVNDAHNMKVGDLLVTNFEGAKYGIPVAVIESINNNEIYAEPVSDVLNLDFVSIVVSK